MPSKRDEKDYRKPCTLCEKKQNVLIRCQIDEEDPKWHFVCTGACWKSVSGGVMDGDKAHPGYRYGGIWKNKHEAISGKKPKGIGIKKDGAEQEAQDEEGTTDIRARDNAQEARQPEDSQS